MPEEARHDRRRFLRNTAMAIAAAEVGMIGVADAQSHVKPSGLEGEQKMSQLSQAQSTSQAQAMRPFRVNVPEAALADLRQRIKATKWPERETVTDASQGVQFATMQKLAGYWTTEYDWRKCEARLNALPQFMSEIDGLDIQFIHVRSKHENALPLIVTHRLPGSIVEQLKMSIP